MHQPQHSASSEERVLARSSPAQPLHTAYVGLGANLGDRLATLRGAFHRLAELGPISAVSPIYETAPVGFAEQPSFLNAAIGLVTELEPQEVLVGLLHIEEHFGRERTFPNAPRTIDLDLLLYDDAVIARPGLIIPHPRLHERPFVLVPLNDIAPDLRHPLHEQTIQDLLRRMGPIRGVQRTGMSLSSLA